MNMHREVDLSRDYRLTAWFYDSGYPETNDYGVLLSIANPDYTWDRGLGLTWAFKTVYIYIDIIDGRQADIYPSNIARTVGWHNATIERVGETLNRYIDDVQVNSTIIFPGESESQVQLATHAIYSITYWDYVTLVTPLEVSVDASPSTGVAPLTVSFTSTAGGGVTPYSYDWSFGDGGTSTAANPTYTYTTAGTFTASVTVLDSRGRVAVHSAEVSVSPDTSLPTIEITSPADEAILASSTVTVEGNAADNVAVDRVEISSDDGATWMPAVGTTSWSATLDLAEGNHVLAARATDTGANVGTARASVIVDLTAPTVSITSPPMGAVLTVDTVLFSWTASDGGSGLDRFEATLDGGLPAVLPGTATSTTLLSVPDGEHTVTLKAIDKADHLTSASMAFKVDVTAPTISITSPDPGATVTSSAVAVVWTAADATSGIERFEVSLDGGAPQSVAGSADRQAFSGLADGSHTVRLTVFDRAGNSAEATVTFRVDTSFFSASGPYGSAGLVGFFGVITVIILTTIVLVARRGRSRPPRQG